MAPKANGKGRRAVNQGTDGSEPFVGARLRADQIVALENVRARVGIPITEQIRRAVDLWLAAQGS